MLFQHFSIIYSPSIPIYLFGLLLLNPFWFNSFQRCSICLFLVYRLPPMYLTSAVFSSNSDYICTGFFSYSLDAFSFLFWLIEQRVSSLGKVVALGF